MATLREKRDKKKERKDGSRESEDCFDRTLIRLIELLFTDFIDTDGMENDGVMEERFD